MAKDKEIGVIEGEVVNAGQVSLSGGLVPVRREEEVINVPGLTSEKPPNLGLPWAKVDQDKGGFDVEGEHVDKLFGCILAIKPTYTRFDKDEKGDPILGPPKCRSLDRLVGIGDPGGDCKKCSIKIWPDEGGKPDCMPTCVLLIAADLGRPMPDPVYLRLKGTSVKPAERYIRNLGRKYLTNIWRALTEITTVPEKYQKTKVYHIATFEQIKGTDFLEIPNLTPILVDLKAQLEDGYGRAAVEHDEPEEPAAEY